MFECRVSVTAEQVGSLQAAPVGAAVYALEAIVLLFIIAGGIVTFVLNGKVDPLWIVLLLFVIAAPIITLLLQRCKLRRLKEKYKAAFGGKPVETCFAVTPSGATYHCPVSEAPEEIAFESFTKMKEEKAYFVLVNKEGKKYVLPKACFTVGSPADFRRFLQKKGVPWEIIA